MDKLIGLLTVIFVGTLLTTITMVISWGLNDGTDKGNNKGQHVRDSDVRIYIPSRFRERVHGNGNDMENGR